MKKSCYFIYLILLLLSLRSFAQTASDLLEKELLAGVKVMPKEIQIYHYFRAPINEANSSKIHPYLDNQVTRAKWVHYFMAYRAGAFWDTNNHKTDLINAGPGVYFAIDPDSSKEFGDTALVLNIAKDTPYLSVANGIPLKKETLNALVKENIIDSKQLNSASKKLGLSKGFTNAALENMVREENSKFRHMIMNFVSRHNISFIEYVYKSHLAGFCKSGNQNAFVFIGTSPNLQLEEMNSAAAENELIASAEAEEVLAHIPKVYQNSILFSNYDLQDLTDFEAKSKYILNRFRNVLARIREVGTGKSAKQAIYEVFNELEVDELAAKSYQCVRKY
jgi:hypothetical protein